jgi:two-component system LytT family response regulator
MMTIRTLIVDDEPLARLNLRSLLRCETDFTIVGEEASAPEAARALAALRPDLLFLDVEMPGASGIDMLSLDTTCVPPAVVFVTAHARFAARAFELEAVDYLLKPFRRERFERVLGRVRDHLQAHATQRNADVGERLVVKSGGRLLLLAFADIDFVRAGGNYVHLHVRDQVHEVRETIGAMLQRLPANRFVRVHRSYVASLEALESLEPTGDGEFIARLRTGKELPVGPTFTHALRSRLRAF